MDIIPKILSLNDFLFNLLVSSKRNLIKMDPRLSRIKRIVKNKPKCGTGKDLYIILNGPSLKSQDLRLLSGKCLMFVNRGFMHPDYEFLQPDYHVFVDSKIRDGVWPIEWVDRIFSLSPKTKVVFPVEWYNHPTFSRFKNDERIIWQVWHVPIYCLGVSGACISFGIYQHFDSIYFTGFDANGCAYDMINSSNSHFYGADPELSNMTTIQHARAMCSTAIHFIDLNRLAEYCKKRGVIIKNLTNGGLLDMFERETL